MPHQCSGGWVDGHYWNWVMHIIVTKDSHNKPCRRYYHHLNIYLVFIFIVVSQLHQAYSSSEACNNHCEEQERLDGVCTDW